MKLEQFAKAFNLYDEVERLMASDEFEANSMLITANVLRIPDFKPKSEKPEEVEYFQNREYIMEDSAILKDYIAKLAKTADWFSEVRQENKDHCQAVIFADLLVRRLIFEQIESCCVMLWLDSAPNFDRYRNMFNDLWHLESTLHGPNPSVYIYKELMYQEHVPVPLASKLIEFCSSWTI